AREHTAGQPKSPLRLIANAIKRSILEPLTSSPEGPKQDSDSKVKASSEQAFFRFPTTPSYSLSQRNSNNNSANSTQPQELKVGEWAGEYLGNRSPLSNPSHFSVGSEERSPRDHSEEVSFPVYSPHTRPSKTTSIPQKSYCTRMEDVPGLLEKFTFKETPPGAHMDDIFIFCDREGNSFMSSLPFMKDRSPEDRLCYPSTGEGMISDLNDPVSVKVPKFNILMCELLVQILTAVFFASLFCSCILGCELLPVRKQATKYSTSSSDDEFESKPSLTHKAKRALRRRRKLEKETKQLIKQEELKRLHKAQ
ncbi:MICAL C-terminal-like, partial [Phoenicopterus ruber ruber]